MWYRFSSVDQGFAAVCTTGIPFKAAYLKPIPTLIFFPIWSNKKQKKNTRNEETSLKKNILQQRRTTREPLKEGRDTPRRNNLDGRFKSQVSELETDLVVAFARAAVGDVVAAFLARNGDLRFGDDGSGEGGAQEVDALFV
jgi:hypothetical protein